MIAGIRPCVAGVILCLEKNKSKSWYKSLCKKTKLKFRKININYCDLGAESPFNRQLPCPYGTHNNWPTKKEEALAATNVRESFFFFFG